MRRDVAGKLPKAVVTYLRLYLVSKDTPRAKARIEALERAAAEPNTEAKIVGESSDADNWRFHIEHTRVAP